MSSQNDNTGKAYRAAAQTRGPVVEAPVTREDEPMRALVQRVTAASVAVEGHVVGRIDRPGLLVLLGCTHDDDVARAVRLAGKAANLRILRDEESCLSVAAPILLVSQFTLYGDTRKGRRPGWSAAAPGYVAEPLVDAFRRELVALGLEVATGVFGADMAVSMVNDGPVTLMLSEPYEPLPSEIAPTGAPR
jgi:D-aminoacyl-tRNA deacylase